MFVPAPAPSQTSEMFLPLIKIEMNHNEDRQELGSHFLHHHHLLLLIFLLLLLLLPSFLPPSSFFLCKSLSSFPSHLSPGLCLCVAGDNAGHFYFPVKHRKEDFSETSVSLIHLIRQRCLTFPQAGIQTKSLIKESSSVAFSLPQKP